MKKIQSELDKIKEYIYKKDLKYETRNVELCPSIKDEFNLTSQDINLDILIKYIQKLEDKNYYCS